MMAILFSESKVKGLVNIYIYIYIEHFFAISGGSRPISLDHITRERIMYSSVSSSLEFKA